MRDTEGVALSDFGAGNDIFTNSATGTVRLLTVEDMSGFSADTTDDTAPTAFDSSIAGYVPAAEGNGAIEARSIMDAGVEEAHLVNLETFTHSGKITLQDTATGGVQAVAGDILAITDAASAAAGPGTGVFQSDGGTLDIDARLDAGITDLADTLVVDSTETLAGGATIINVAAANTTGARYRCEQQRHHRRW